MPDNVRPGCEAVSRTPFRADVTDQSTHFAHLFVKCHCPAPYLGYTKYSMSEHDLMRIRRVGDRLRAGLRTLVEGFPPSARNISGMSRWLGVHKATCQRIVEGLDPGRDGLTAFSRLF